MRSEAQHVILCKPQQGQRCQTPLVKVKALIGINVKDCFLPVWPVIYLFFREVVKHKQYACDIQNLKSPEVFSH